jgi:hypothetical protein
MMQVRLQMEVYYGFQKKVNIEFAGSAVSELWRDGGVRSRMRPRHHWGLALGGVEAGPSAKMELHGGQGPGPDKPFNHQSVRSGRLITVPKLLSIC